jgi:hypothetical protein
LVSLAVLSPLVFELNRPLRPVFFGVEAIGTSQTRCRRRCFGHNLDPCQVHSWIRLGL